MIKGLFLRAITCVWLLATVSACATWNRQADGEIYDPLEKMNRATFAFNRSVDRAVIDPVSSAYIKYVPEPPRDGVSNVMRNLREPWVFINDILQLKLGRAGATLGRFALNSTVGIGGLFKVSDKFGIKYHSEDLGQTLALWGVRDGPYLILPFIGPSNARDTTGFVANIFLDPVSDALKDTNVDGANLIRTGIEAFDTRARLDEVLDGVYEEDDPYVLMRSVYLQRRRNAIYDGRPPEPEEDIFDEIYEDIPDR